MVTDFVTGMLNENDFRSSLTVKNKASNSQNSHQKKIYPVNVLSFFVMGFQ